MLLIVSDLIRLGVGKLVADFNSVQRKALWLIDVVLVLASLLCQNPGCLRSLQWQAGNKAQEKSCRSRASPGAGWHNFNWFECELHPFRPGLEFAPGMGWLSAASLNQGFFLPQNAVCGKRAEQKQIVVPAWAVILPMRNVTNMSDSFSLSFNLDFNFY